MKVRVGSFSYRKGYPVDPSEHGGGFVFDCRFIKNPGREPQYKEKNGRDAEVAEYILALPEANQYFDSVLSIINSAIKSYTARGFDYLSVQFGCTGGQHRSVYFAERLVKELKKNSELIVELTHKDCPVFPK